MKSLPERMIRSTLAQWSLDRTRDNAYRAGADFVRPDACLNVQGFPELSVAMTVEASVADRSRSRVASEGPGRDRC